MTLKNEEDPTHTFDDESEDDTADSQQVLSFVGAAQANHARVLRQKRTCGRSLVCRFFMPGTTRTDRDGSREGFMCATSTREILRMLPQSIFLCDTASR